MSANLDLVRSIYDRWGRGDFTSGDWADPEIEFGFVDGPEPGSWIGIKNMADRYGEWLRGWRDFRAEPEQFIVADETRILVFVHNSGLGRTSGVQMDERSVANLFEIHDGRVTRLVIYWQRDRALADVGLEEYEVPEESTTPDLAELSRRLNEAINRGDLDAALAMYTPDAVWDLSGGGVGVFEGRDAIRGFWEDWLGAYEEWEQVAEELRDLGNGVGFGVLRQRGRPAGSSGFVELHYAFVGIVRGDGLTERIMLYADLDDARAAAERLAEERG